VGWRGLTGPSLACFDLQVARACLRGWLKSSVALLGCNTACLCHWPVLEPGPWDAKSLLSHGSGETSKSSVAEEPVHVRRNENEANCVRSPPPSSPLVTSSPSSLPVAPSISLARPCCLAHPTPPHTRSHPLAHGAGDGDEAAGGGGVPHPMPPHVPCAWRR
jgi:hypothetical protein